MRKYPVLAALALGVLTSVVYAQDRERREFAMDTSLYGQLDVSAFKSPAVANTRPVFGHEPQSGQSPKAPAYLHVIPGHESKWSATCRLYQACEVPVYFVKEAWFVHVYLPSAGSHDGREQRYREVMRRARDERSALQDYGE